MEKIAKNQQEIYEKYKLVLDYYQGLGGSTIFVNNSKHFYISRELIYRVSAETLTIDVKLDPQLNPVDYLTISPNDKFLAVGNIEEMKIFKTDIHEPLFELIEEGRFEIKQVQFLTNSKKILVGFTEEKLDLWDFKRSVKLSTLKFPGIILKFLISEANDKTFVIGGDSFKVFDLRNSSVKTKVKTSAELYAMAKTSNDSLLVLGDEEGKIFIFDTRSNCFSQLYDAKHSNWVEVIRVSPCDKLAATGGMCRFIYVWDLNTQKVKFQLEVSPDCFTTFLVFLKKSSCIGFAKNYVFVSIWNLKERQTRIIGKHESLISQGEISKDLQVFLTCSNDKILLWNAKSLELIREVCGHSAPVRCVLDLGIIGRVVSAACDNCIKIWDIDEKADKITLSECRDVDKIVRYKEKYLIAISEVKIYTVLIM